MSANLSCSGQVPGASAAVHGDWFLDDEAIGEELPDGLAGVGVGDFVQLIGIEPDLAFAAASDGRGKPLLSSKVHPVER
jgi:hypothetical protein